ncbi:MAG: MFS transporter [Dehalococcoidia bacterium]|nr:MFS transporter [Dehalococcoidia bacterium]
MSNRVSTQESSEIDGEAISLWRRLLSIPPALKYPQYRSYWFGTLASVCGFQMLMFSQGWLTYELTGSPLYLGYVAVASAVPSIALNLFGGVFADRLDKRKLIFYTQILTATLIFTLAFLTLFEVVRVWHIIALAFAAGAVNAFDQPARQALYPHLIDRRVIMSAVALNSAIWQGTRIVAPMIAGIIIGLIGTATAIFVAGAGFVIMAIVILTLRIPRIDIGSTGSAFGALWEGLRFISGSSIFSFLIAMTFFNSFFGMAYITMMPAFAVDVLKVGADGQGLLMTVGGVGALGVTLLLSSSANFQRKGLLIIGGGLAFGISIIAFALTSRFVGSLPLAMVLMFIMGTSSSTYMISIMSSLQLLVPDRMRGRVMGFYGMTWSIMPLGGMQAGALASFVGVPVAIAIGGGLVAAFALGPALINRQVRNIGSILMQSEQEIQSNGSDPQRVRSAS